MPVITRSQSNKIIPEAIPRNAKGHPMVGGLTLRILTNKKKRNMTSVTQV